MSSINLKIISPIETIFACSCYLVKLQTVEGEIAIASRHQSIITQLKSGMVSIYNHQQQLIKEVKITGGLCQFTNNSAINVSNNISDDEMVIITQSF